MHEISVGKCYVDQPLPCCNLKDIKDMYKNFIDNKKNQFNKCISVEI
ncbi:MAG: hypothetical protein Satyrvirus35_8, partial [Satyrvirus sp.]